MDPIEKSLLTGIIAGVFVFIMLIIFFTSLVFIYLKKRKKHELQMLTLKQAFEKELLQSQIEVQEATFSSVARELHDNIGQLMNSSKMIVATSRIKNQEDPALLILAEETIGKAIAEMRALSKSLNKDWLDQFDFTDNLQAEINRINAAQRINATIECPSELSLSTDTKIILFRIIQEAMQNTVKHSQATHLHINIQSEGEVLKITIQDDGIGLPETVAEGQGFTNIKKRAALLNGRARWYKPEGNGCVVELSLPINQHA